MSHSTYVDESWHICEWAMAHTCMSHGTCVNKSWHILEWVMANMILLTMCHSLSSTILIHTHTNESWHICECVMAHMWMRHGTYVNESWHTYKWVMSRYHVQIYYETPRSDVRKDDEEVMAHTYERVTSQTWTSHVTHSHGTQYERVTSHTWTSHVTHMNASGHTYERVMSRYQLWIHYKTSRKSPPKDDEDSGVGQESSQGLFSSLLFHIYKCTYLIYIYSEITVKWVFKTDLPQNKKKPYHFWAYIQLCRGVTCTYTRHTYSEDWGLGPWEIFWNFSQGVLFVFWLFQMHMCTCAK